MTVEHPPRLSAAQAELLARRLRGAAGGGASEPTALTRRARDERPVLSFAQQRLWFLEQMHPGSIAYITADTVYRVRGPLDVPALRQALRSVAERHVTLRSHFADDAGQPYVVVGAADRITLRVVDLAGRADPAAAAEAYLADELRTPFDLATGPLLRTTLLRLGEDDHILAAVVHHIAFDGWSIGVFERDLATAYRAVRTGEAPGWAPLPVDYTDYAAWQHEMLTGRRAEGQLEHWRQALRGAPTTLQLPTDRPRPAAPGYRGSVVAFTVGEETADRLRALSRAQGATLFMTALAAYQVLLSRHTHSTDFLVGCPSAGRTRPEVEELVGFFVNTLPVRADLTGDPTVRQLVDRARAAALDAFAHQELPFQRIIEEVAPPRETSHNPLVQVWFDVSAPGAGLRLDGAEVESVRPRRPSTNFDLALHLTESGSGPLTGELVYATDLFDEATGRSLAAQYVHVLEEAARHPDRPVADLPLVDAGRLAELLDTWNDTARPVPEGTVTDAFERQVRHTPDATALVEGDRRLTYRELNARANRLAHELRAHGVRPERTVGLLLPRGTDFVVALLAVLKAGGGYLPLDPAYPADRIAYLLRDASAGTVVTDQRLAGLLPAGVPAVLLEPDGFGQHPSTDPTPLATGGSLCYVIYTSGSTGRPKGVAMAHAPLRNLIQWQIERTTVTGPTLQFSSLYFDASFQELFTTFLTGGSLVLISEEQRRDPRQVLAAVRAHGVRRLFCPPMVLEQLAVQDAAEAAAPPPLKEIVTAGERLTLSKEIRAFLARMPGVVLENQCGPTETHAVVAHLMTGPPEDWPTNPPIGRPIANTRVDVLDERMRPVPVGVPGELYVTRPWLARGYVGRPDLTAERFLPSPYATGPGQLMYRTGDLVRWRPDGTVEFLGRADDQVKIRGYRVEPAEVEARLRELPEVGEVAVLPVEVAPGDRRLVAYLTTIGGSAPGPAGLRALLAKSLPDYLIPSHFVTVPRLPLTATGKLDRHALLRTELPAPEQGTEAGSRAPRDPREEILAGLFAEVLGLPKIGAEDDFFALGGHSLLATRLIARIRSAFGAELAIRDLFRTPTVAGLVHLLEASRPARPALVPAARPAVLPLSPAQRRIWFLSRTGQSADYNSPFALRLRGRLDADALAAALADVVARHEALRTVFPDHDGDPRQHILPAGSVPSLLEHAECPPGDLDRLLATFAEREFDLAAEPPLRAALYRAGPEEHVLALVVHHIATDGWSLGVLLRDLSTAYTARVVGEEPRLPALPVQYADFALWQLGLLAEEQDPDSSAARQLSFWRERLAGLPTELELPYDRPRPETADNCGGIVPLTLDGELHARLLRLAGAHGCTLLMVLHAALAALLSRLGAGTDIPIGVPAAGRGDEALDDLVGVFVNTLVLRTDVSANPTFAELLSRVRDADLAAYEHADLPFERVVEAVNPDRALARHPLFQVVLQLDGSVTDGLVLPGLEVVEEPVRFEVSKFDLRIALTDSVDADGAPGGLHGVLEYAEALFDRVTAEALAGRLRRMLEQLAADPDRRIGSVDLLTAQERRRILVDWNDTAADVPERTVPELFEQCARETPDAPAVRGGTTVLSYAELNERANRFARHLASLGIGPERLVAVALPRTPELVAVLLGVLKAGAGYLPLDPEQPPERLARIVTSAAPALAVTTTALAERLPPLTRLLLDEPDSAAAVDRHPAADLDPAERTAELTAATTAYVIYTSGSTGEPKGVVIEHGSLNLYLAWARHAYPAMAGRALVHSPVAFDLTVTGLWGPLTCGGSLELVTLDDEPAAVEQPTFVKATPSHLGLFQILPETYAPTGQLVLGGELLLGAALDEWRADHPGVTVVNEYGPTETTVGCAEYRIEPGDRVPAGGVTIGHPIWNTRWYVLDDALSPVPAGVVGELYIGGGLLARGYLNQPDLTAARFLPDPYGPPGARMYRTGDLVRWRHDGQAEFVGRVDDQVKVRGFRVELGEVEAVLSTLPGVAAAAATVLGGDRLVAYLVPAAPEGLDTESVRAAAAGLLPAYMLPSAYVLLDRLPLTANGKLDRRRLPAPKTPTAGAGRAPETELEKALCGLFAEVLGLPHVGVDDGFFALGGHSLLAARLVTRIRSALGLRVGVQDLFTAPSVAALAARLAAGVHQDSLAPLLTLRAGRPEQRPPLFCIHPGAGIGWVYAALLDRLDPDQPVYAVQAPTLRPDGTAAASVAELAAGYLVLIRQVQPSGPYRLLGWSFGALVAHAMAVGLQEQGEEVELLAMLDGYPPEPDATATEPADGPDPLAELLRSLGQSVAESPGERLTVAEFIRLTGQGDGPLAGLDGETISAMARTFIHHATLGRAHRPGVFRGGAVFFHAAADPDSGDPRAWRRFLSEDLEVHPVDCVHGVMMHRRPAERIGAVLADELRRPRA
ncbi:amino acid adenylation domain-containing protein [Streptomyces sp. NPDC046881]|uniref:amino acid adenylation domain-containing protein n=1 Tax=Streptomyces sp. NPDC046881 TaxID=3155374 RepID=UPI0033CDD7BC